MILARKLKLLKNDLKKWNKEVFGNLEERKSRAMSRLERLDQERAHNQINEQVDADRISIIKEREEIAIEEEISWRQKSRCL